MLKLDSFKNSLKGNKIKNNLPSIHTIWRPNLGNRASFLIASQSALYTHFLNVNNVYVSIELGLFQIIRDQFQVTLLKKFRPQIVRCIRMLIFFLKAALKILRFTSSKLYLSSSILISRSQKRLHPHLGFSFSASWMSRRPFSLTSVHLNFQLLLLSYIGSYHTICLPFVVHRWRSPTATETQLQVWTLIGRMKWWMIWKSMKARLKRLFLDVWAKT